MLGVCFLVSLHVPPVFIDPHVSPITPCLCPYVSHTCLNISICISICMFLSGSVCHCILCTCLCSNIGGPLTHLDPLQVHQGEELQDVVSSNQEDAKAPTMTSLKSLGLPQPGFQDLLRKSSPSLPLHFGRCLEVLDPGLGATGNTVSG